jgi:hypothetical protein
MTEYTQEERDTINSLVDQINEVAEKQQDHPYVEDGFIIFWFKKFADGEFVIVRDDYLQSTVGQVDYPLTALPRILVLMKEGIDILDAVDIVKVREALELIQYHVDCGNLNDEEAMINLEAAEALRHLKNKCKMAQDKIIAERKKIPPMLGTDL